MTYQEVQDRLSRVQSALTSLQDGTYNNVQGINIPQTISQLQEIEESLKSNLSLLAEEEDGVIYTDDEQKAQRLADKGAKVKLSENQFSVEETRAIAKKTGKAVGMALRKVGEQMSSMKAKNIAPNQFSIYVEFKNGEEEYAFYINEDDTLMIDDRSYDRELTDVGTMPSGEAVVNVDVLADKLVQYFKEETVNEMDINDPVLMKMRAAKAYKPGPKPSPRRHPKPKNASDLRKLAALEKHRAQIMRDMEQEAEPEGGPVADRYGDMLNKIDKAIAMLQSPEEKEYSLTREYNTGIYYDPAKERNAAKGKKNAMARLRDKLAKAVTGDYQPSITEAPEGMYYLKVDLRDARKALEIIDDNPAYAKAVEMSGSDVYYLSDESLAYDLYMDFGAHDINVYDTNVEDDEFDMDYKNESEVDKIDHEGGDLDIGHQDDEPNMLKKDLYDVATYAAKLYKQLDKYDQHDGEVDFPHWWQKKVTLAREYMSAAQHYLEAEEKQPALDQLALQERYANHPAMVQLRTKNAKAAAKKKREKKDIKEWGSSDQHAMNQSIHRDLGAPKQFPGLTQIMRAAEEAVDFYWDDWEEYKTDREGLVMYAAQRYANKMFPDFMSGMRKMLEPVDENAYIAMMAANAAKKGKDKKPVKEGTWSLGSAKDIKSVMSAVKQMMDLKNPKDIVRYLSKLDKFLYDTVGDDLFHDDIDGAKREAEEGNLDRAINRLSDAKDRAEDLYKKVAERESSRPYPNFSLEEEKEVKEGTELYDRNGIHIKRFYGGERGVMVQITIGGKYIVVPANEYPFLARAMQSVQGDLKDMARQSPRSKNVDEASIAKIQKSHSAIVAHMKELAKLYKAGDKSVVDTLKDLTARKKELEKQLDAAVAGTGKGQELDGSIDEEKATYCGACGKTHKKSQSCPK